MPKSDDLTGEQMEHTLVKSDIKSLAIEELRALMRSIGEPEFHALQVFRWLHAGVTSFDEMSNLSKALREKLNSCAFITAPVILKKQRSEVDGTVKYLWELNDKNSVESVLMSYQHGNSICVSTQAGCRMGCVFCASGKNGLARNLTPSEILDQIVFRLKRRKHKNLKRRFDGNRRTP